MGGTAKAELHFEVVIDRVVDGDTVDAYVDLGFGIAPGSSQFDSGLKFIQTDLGFGVIFRDGRLMIKERLRLAGIDAPESRTSDKREKKFGLLATERVKELLPRGKSFLITSKSFEKAGKFGRALVDFVISTNPEAKGIRKENYFLTQLLIKEHLAVPYNGENKKDIRELHEVNWDLLEKLEQV